MLVLRRIRVHAESVAPGRRRRVEPTAEHPTEMLRRLIRPPGDDEVPAGVESDLWLPAHAPDIRVGVDLELWPLRRAGGVEPPAEGAGTPGRLAAVLRPHDGEPAIRFHVHVRENRRAGQVRADLEVGPLGGAQRVETARADPGRDVAAPDHDEVPGRIRCDVGKGLAAGGERARRDLREQRSARRIEASHPGREAARSVPVPCDDEVVAGVHRHRGPDLQAGRVGRHGDLAALRRAVGIEHAGEDAEATPVLAFGLPHDDEVPQVAPRDRRPRLGAGGMQVDLELGFLRDPLRVEPSREDLAIGEAHVVADPRHHEVAVGVRGDGGRQLVAGGVVAGRKFEPRPLLGRGGRGQGRQSDAGRSYEPRAGRGQADTPSPQVIGHMGLQSIDRNRQSKHDSSLAGSGPGMRFPSRWGVFFGRESVWSRSKRR